MRGEVFVFLSRKSQYNLKQNKAIENVTLGHLAYGWLCLFFLASPLIFYLFTKTFNFIPECVGDIDSCVLLPSSKKFASATWGAVFSLAATAGCLGTIISFLLRETKPESIVSDSIPIVATRVVVAKHAIIILAFFGMTFGLIMLALFVGGFVQGSLFPSPFGESWVKINVRIQDWAKIFVWCFLAGFSERLIPDLLNSLVHRIEPKYEQEKNRSADAADAKQS
jgi:hypothetical protein